MQRILGPAGIAGAVREGLDAAGIGHGVDHGAEEEMEAPFEVSPRHLWQGAFQRLQEAAARLVEGGSEDAPPDPLRLRRQPRAQLDEGRPAETRLHAEGQGRAQKGVEDLLQQGRAARGLRAIGETAQSLRRDRRGAAREDLFEEAFLGSKMVVQGGEVDVRGRRQRAHTDAGPAVLGEQALRRREQTPARRRRRERIPRSVLPCAAASRHPATLTDTNVCLR